jgi:organic hydroperoxide reductase OsmC/OhrA
MSLHTATIRWARGDAAFTDRRYSRAHAWHFDGGAVVPASSSPQVVRVPFSDPSAVDPEEAFVASLSSCHMLWFLDLAAQAGWCVDRYEDAAEGLMQRDAAGHDWIARVVLRPRVAFAGERQPDAAALAELHHRAHESCFLARSVRSEVVVESPPSGAGDTQLRDSAAPGQR